MRTSMVVLLVDRLQNELDATFADVSGCPFGGIGQVGEPSLKALLLVRLRLR